MASVRPVKSAERVLSVFEYYSRLQRPLTVSDISRGLDIPQPSASMLLANLRQLGYLDYNQRTRTYVPSIRIALLGSWIERHFSATGGLARRLSELSRQLDECAFVCIQNEAAVQFVLVENPHAAYRLNVDSGVFRSLIHTAAGRLLLSLKADQEVVSWVRRCNAEPDPGRSKIPETRMLEIVRAIRRDGYAQTQGEATPGLSAMAIHLRSPTGVAPLAVGCVASIEHMAIKRDEALRLLRDLRDASDEDRPARREDF